MDSEADFLAAIAAGPGDETVYAAFADWLEERGDPRAAWVRSPAVRPWMGERFGDPMPALVAALKAKRRVLEVRRAMPDLGAAAVPAVAELLGDESSIVRLHAVLCLRKIGPTAAEAMSKLLAALDDVSNEVRRQAANAIRDLRRAKGSPPPPRGTAEEGAPAARPEPQHDKDAALDRLLAFLYRARGGELNHAVKTLAKASDARVVRPLCLALSHESAGVRDAAAFALIWLARRDPDEAVLPLRGALADASAEVRAHAAVALGLLGRRASAALPELIRRLDDENAEARRAAAQALGGIAAGDPEILEVLHRTTTDRDAQVANAAVEAMNRWPALPPESGEVLLALIARLGQWQRCYAMTALVRVQQPTPAVLAVLRAGVVEGSWEAADALGRMGRPEATPDLIQAARSGNYRAGAALGRACEVSALVEMLDDPSEEVRQQGVLGLRAAGEAAVVALPRLREIVRTPDDPRRWWAIGAIREIGPAAVEAAPDLIALLSDAEQWGCGAEAHKALAAFGPDLLPHAPALAALAAGGPPARVRAVRLLAGLASHSADLLGPLRLATRLFKGKDAAEVRRYAAEGLGRIGPAACHDVTALLTDPAEAVRREAAVALGRIGARDAAGSLCSALRDPAESVRARAAEALGAIGSGAEALAAAGRDGSERVRRAAAAALKKLRRGRQGPA
jgi:uncharacterized protein (TIGR02996 family)